MKTVELPVTDKQYIVDSREYQLSQSQSSSLIGRLGDKVLK